MLLRSRGVSPPWWRGRITFHIGKSNRSGGGAAKSSGKKATSRSYRFVGFLILRCGPRNGWVVRRVPAGAVVRCRAGRPRCDAGLSPGPTRRGPPCSRLREGGSGVQSGGSVGGASGAGVSRRSADRQRPQDLRWPQISGSPAIPSDGRPAPATPLPASSATQLQRPRRRPMPPRSHCRRP